MAFVTGIGWITADGMGCGRQGGRIGHSRGPLPKLVAAGIFSTPCLRFGRMDPLTQLALSAMAFALRDAGLEAWEQQRPIGVFATSVNGCLATDQRYFATVIPHGGKLASPHLFAYTLASSFLGEAAIHFGLTGPSLTLSEAPGDQRWCLTAALVSLEAGECEILIAGVCDLGPPAAVIAAGEPTPGALFVVLERANGRRGLVYGGLRLDPSGPILFDDTPVRDFRTLARLGLQTLTSPKPPVQEHELP